MPRTGALEPITVREYEPLSYDLLSEDAVRRLERLAESRGPRIFDFHRTHARARHYVGTVKTGGVTIQILPKIYDKDEQNLAFLIFLLRYTRRLGLRQAGVTTYEKLRGSLLEIWIEHFATELNRLLRTHPKHRYVEVDERVGFLRGKLLTERELAATGTLTGRYACRYELFTPNHLLNQTLKFCNSLLRGQARMPTTRTILDENAARLAEVSDRTVRTQDLAKIRTDRLDREYEPLLEMCRLLIEGYAPGLRAGGVEQLAFVFDMNALFEEFVARFLRRHKDRIELGDGRRLDNVEAQRALGRLFGEFNMKVDLVLTDTEGERFLVDTKYKVLDTSKLHDGLSQSDFYQMYAYGNAGRHRYERIVLLYPATEPAVDRVFHQPRLALQVRQFDLRKICHSDTGRLDVDGAARELSRALSWDDNQ